MHVVQYVTSAQVEIKTYIVSLMLSCPPSLRAQLSEALTIISRTDFPGQWESLLPELSQKLVTQDVGTIVGVFETIASVFKRFQTCYIEDAGVNEALDYCQKQISEPVLRVIQVRAAVMPHAAMCSCECCA